MWDSKKSKAERLIYLHVLREAYKAKIITIAARKADPRALLLPGRENTWWRYVIRKSAVMRINKKLPDIEEATRLHPPINAIVKNLHRNNDTKRAKPTIHRKWVENVMKEWKEQGCPQAGPQLVNDTLLLIKGKKGQLFLHCNAPQEKIRFVVGADLLKIKEERNKE